MTNETPAVTVTWGSLFHHLRLDHTRTMSTESDGIYGPDAEGRILHLLTDEELRVIYEYAKGYFNE